MLSRRSSFTRTAEALEKSSVSWPSSAPGPKTYDQNRWVGVVDGSGAMDVTKFEHHCYHHPSFDVAKALAHKMMTASCHELTARYHEFNLCTGKAEAGARGH